jgi:hypothetical protein
MNGLMFVIRLVQKPRVKHKKVLHQVGSGLMFVISYSVCLRRGFLARSNFCGLGQEPKAEHMKVLHSGVRVKQRP